MGMLFNADLRILGNTVVLISTILAPIAADASLVLKDGSPIGVVRAANDVWHVRKTGGWFAVRATESHVAKNAYRNQYNFPQQTIDEIKRCLVSGGCEVLSTWRAGDGVPLAQQTSDADYRVPIVRRITEQLFVAYDPADHNRALVIDAGSGRIGRALRNSRIKAVDVKTQRIISAECQLQYECSFFSTDLIGKNTRLVANLAFGVADVQSRDGVIYVLAKSASAKKHFASLLFGWAGHPSSFEDFFIVEVNIETGSVRSTPVLNDLKNAGGRFLFKWDEQ